MTITPTDQTLPLVTKMRVFQSMKFNDRKYHPTATSVFFLTLTLSNIEVPQLINISIFVRGNHTKPIPHIVLLQVLLCQVLEIPETQNYQTNLSTVMHLKPGNITVCKKKRSSAETYLYIMGTRIYPWISHNKENHFPKLSKPVPWSFRSQSQNDWKENK